MEGLGVMATGGLCVKRRGGMERPSYTQPLIAVGLKEKIQISECFLCRVTLRVSPASTAWTHTH